MYSNQDSLVFPLHTEFFDEDWFKQQTTERKASKKTENQRNNPASICSFSPTPPPSFQLPSGLSGAPINSVISIKKKHNTARRISHAYIDMKLWWHALLLEIQKHVIIAACKQQSDHLFLSLRYYHLNSPVRQTASKSAGKVDGGKWQLKQREVLLPLTIKFHSDN